MINAGCARYILSVGLLEVYLSRMWSEKAAEMFAVNGLIGFFISGNFIAKCNIVAQC
jgi:hypothetical protein